MMLDQKQGQLCQAFSLMSHTIIEFAVHTLFEKAIPISENRPLEPNACVVYHLWPILFWRPQFRPSSCLISECVSRYFTRYTCTLCRHLAYCEFIRVLCCHARMPIRPFQMRTWQNVCYLHLHHVVTGRHVVIFVPMYR
jgi:hypothetical protein